MRRLVPAIPALAIALVLWAWTRLHFDYPSTFSGGGSWHYLGPHLLLDKPLESLAALHVQPPGLNATRALDLMVTPSSHLLASMGYLAAMLVSVWLVVDAAVQIGISRRWSGVCGVVYALLPATVLYAFSVNSTTPTMLGCALAIWGLTVMGRHPSLGASFSAVGVVILFLYRSSFTWFFVAGWLIALLVLIIRRQRRGTRARTGMAVAGVGLVLVLGLQIHYVASFGLYTLSSWTGENLYKALRQSNHLHVTDSAREAARAMGPCQASLIDAIEGGADVAWRPEAFYALPGCAALRPTETTGVEALDSPLADGEYDGGWVGNFNWRGRLVASAVFTDVMRAVFKGDPSQLVYMAISGGAGTDGSGLGIYLSPPEDNEFLTGILTAYPDKSFGGLMGLFFAPVALFLTGLGVVVSVLRRERGRLRRAPAFWFGTALIVYHAGVSTLVEYGENNRFQAEITPILLVVSAMVLWAVIPHRDPQTAPRPWRTARTVRASSTMSPDSDQVST